MALTGPLRAIKGTYYSDSRWLLRKDNEKAINTSRRCLFDVLNKYFTKVSAKRPAAGDLLAMAFKNTGEIDHVGIYDGKGSIIHADMKRGVVKIDYAEHERRIVAVFRL